MANTMTNEELEKLTELTRRTAEQNRIKSSNAAALEAAREQIRERGRFVPKVDRPNPVQSSF